MITVKDILETFDDIKAVHVYVDNHCNVYIGDYDIECITPELLDKPVKKYGLVTLYNDKDVRLNVWL